MPVNWNIIFLKSSESSSTNPLAQPLFFSANVHAVTDHNIQHHCWY